MIKIKKWFKFSLLFLTSLSFNVYSICPVMLNMMSSQSKMLPVESIKLSGLNSSAQDWVKALGPAAREVGSGLHILEWDLIDGRLFRISFLEACEKVLYARIDNAVSSSPISSNIPAVYLTEPPTASMDVSLFKNKYLSDVNAQELSLEEHAWYEYNIKALLTDSAFEHSQYLVVADRNPLRQVASVVYWNAESKRLNIFGWSPISTGSHRKGHFITPLGVFQNKPENPSYRAMGTPNENGIRGIGSKGMRVFDFGWTASVRGWGKEVTRDIRFQMHATDPFFLEQRLGTPDSKGCVRIVSALNKFLDKYGVLDSLYENSPRGWMLAKDRETVSNAGSFLIVLDSSSSSLPALKNLTIPIKAKK